MIARQRLLTLNEQINHSEYLLSEIGRCDELLADRISIFVSNKTIIDIAATMLKDSTQKAKYV